MNYFCTSATALMVLLILCCTTNPGQSSNIHATDPIAINPDIYSMNMHMDELYIKGKAIPDRFKIDVSYLETDTDKKNLPVIYITDGHWRKIDHKYIHYLSYNKIIPPVFAVGIGYPPGYDYNKIRERDLLWNTDSFLKFITEEVIQFVEKNYSCDPGKRLLFGASYGGHFAVKAFLKNALRQDNTFYGYIGSSSWLCNTGTYELVSKLRDAKIPVPYNLYLSYGGSEDYFQFISPNDLLFNKIEESNYEGLNFIHYQNPDNDHYTATRPTLIDGIRLFLSPIKPEGIGFTDMSNESLLYNFSSCVQIYDWNYSARDCAAITFLEFKPGFDIKGDSASGSMKAMCDFSSGSSEAGKIGSVFDHFEDLSGKTIEFNIYIPEDIANSGYKLEFYIMSTYNWIEDKSEPYAIEKSGWNNFRHKWKSTRMKGNPKKIREIGIYIIKGKSAPGWSGDLYIDDINW